MPPSSRPRPAEPTHPLEQALYEVKKTIVGQDRLLERMFVALLARGHLLVEGVPGLAKTMAVKSLAEAIGGQFQRIQFTPDLVPADIIGTRIYNQRDGEFQVSLGPVFANLLLADEINRAPAKVQSALLEVMQERQVTIGRETFPAPEPFLVMATQNPIESEGTYSLPEAQVDRFMLKVLVGYPTPPEEFVIVERMTSARASPPRSSTSSSCAATSGTADAVYVDPGVIEYAVRLATATRDPAAVGPAATCTRTCPSAPAPARRSTWSSGPRRSPSCGGGTTPCPSTSATSPATCCATGSCCRTRRSRTPSRPTTCSSRCSRRFPCRTSRCVSAATPSGGRAMVDRAGPDARERPAPPGVAGHPPPRRPAARRLPDAVPRRRGSTSWTCASTSPATTCATSTGTSPPGWTRRTSASTSRTASVTAWLLLDRSPSMGFGPVDRASTSCSPRSPRRVAQLLSRGGNRVGAMLFDAEVDEIDAARSGRNQVLRIISRLLAPRRRARAPLPPGGPLGRGPGGPRSSSGRAGAQADDRLAVPLRAAQGIARRRSMVVIVSDFISRARLGAAAHPARRPARRGGPAGASTGGSSTSRRRR